MGTFRELPAPQVIEPTPAHLTTLQQAARDGGNGAWMGERLRVSAEEIARVPSAFRAELDDVHEALLALVWGFRDAPSELTRLFAASNQTDHLARAITEMATTFNEVLLVRLLQSPWRAPLLARRPIVPDSAQQFFIEYVSAELFDRHSESPTSNWLDAVRAWSTRGVITSAHGLFRAARAATERHFRALDDARAYYAAAIALQFRDADPEFLASVVRHLKDISQLAASDDRIALAKAIGRSPAARPEHMPVIHRLLAHQGATRDVLVELAKHEPWCSSSAHMAALLREIVTLKEIPFDRLVIHEAIFWLLTPLLTTETFGTWCHALIAAERAKLLGHVQWEHLAAEIPVHAVTDIDPADAAALLTEMPYPIRAWALLRIVPRMKEHHLEAAPPNDAATGVPILPASPRKRGRR